MAAIPAPTHAQPAAALAGQARVSRPPRCEFIALTGQDALLEEIGQALDGESAFRHVESLDAACESIRPLRPCVLLLDSRACTNLAATVERVQSPDGTCIVVVLAPVDASTDVARSLKGSATFAILPIPIEPGQTAAVLEGAREEALARLTLAEQSVAEPATPAASPRPSAPSSTASAPVAASPASARATHRNVADAPTIRRATAESASGGPRRSWILVAAGVALLVGAVVWYTQRAPGPQAPAAVVPAPATRPAEPAIAPPAQDATAGLEGSVEELLDKARVAMNNRHYTDPQGDNALGYFRAILAQDPGNDEAREGLQRIGALLDERLQAELAQHKFNDAAGTLAQLKLIRPDDVGLRQADARLAEAQIAAALDAGNVERATQLLRQAAQLGTLPEPAAARWREEIGRRQGDARGQQLAKLVSTRIREGKLVEPATDSAKAHLAQLRKLPADPRGLADAATAELQQAFLQKIREAAAQSRREELDRWLAEARKLGVNPTRLAAAMRTTPSATTAPAGTSQAERLAQQVQERIRDGRLLEPSQDSALAYLSALRSADPSAGALNTSTRALSDALLRRGREVLADRDLESAQAHASAARRLGVNLEGVDALERGIAAARAKPATSQAPQGEIKRTRYVPPEYPKDAAKRGIAGEVRVRITVDADGKVKSAAIVNSNPANVFDQAALDAVRRWRFKPLADDNPDVEATVVTNIVFRPEDVSQR